jgi:hypothetical protein
MTEAMEALQQSLSMVDDDSKDYTRVTATGLAHPWKVSAARREARKAMMDDIQENAQGTTNSQSRFKAKKKKKDEVVKEGEVRRRDEALSDPRHCGVFDGLPGAASSNSVGGETNNSSMLVDTIEALQRSSSISLASVTSLAFGATTDDDGAIAPATNEVDDDVVHDTVKCEIADACDKVIVNDSLETNEATTTIVKPTMSACDQSEAGQRSSVCVEYTVADYKQVTKRDPRWLLLMARDQISIKKRTLPIVIDRSSNNAINNMGGKLSKLRNIVKQKSKTLFERKKMTKKMDHERTCKDMNVQTDIMSVSSKLTKSTRLSKDNIEVTETELRQHLNKIESEWKSAWPMNSDAGANHQTNVSVLSVSFDSNDIIAEDNEYINVDYERNNTRYCGGFSPNSIGGSLGPILEENSMSFVSNGEEEEEERNNSFDDDYSSIIGTNQLSYDTTYATSMDGTEVELFMCGCNDRNH